MVVYLAKCVQDFVNDYPLANNIQKHPNILACIAYGVEERNFNMYSRRNGGCAKCYDVWHTNAETHKIYTQIHTCPSKSNSNTVNKIDIHPTLSKVRLVGSRRI